MLERPIEGKDSGSRRPAKTPSAADAYTGNMKKDEFKFGDSGSLAQEVESGFLETHRMWPTPQATERGGKQTPGSHLSLSKAVHGWKKDGTKLWPTPRANSAMSATITPESAWKENRFPNLETVVGRIEYPTPAARDWKDGNHPAERARNTPPLAVHAGGQLNPTWVEWLMGWPLGWTDLKPLAMGKYQQWLRQHGEY